MGDIKLISDYKKDEIYRQSFDQLAHEVFGIGFEKWYQNGFWDDRYVCYSYIDEDRVVANVSINKMTLIIGDEKKKAMQIGTVMTHPAYRNRGLSRSLMEIVLEKYQKEYEFIYLFANHTVLNFYPKFGFRALSQYQFSVSADKYRTGAGNKNSFLKKLNTSDEDDLKLLTGLVTGRRPVSDVFGVVNAEGILLWYGFNVFNNDLYYIPEKHIIIIFQKEGPRIHIYDILSRDEFNFADIAADIVTGEVREIVLHFTPDRLGIETTASILPADDDVFFVKTAWPLTNKPFQYPITAHA